VHDRRRENSVANQGPHRQVHEMSAVRVFTEKPRHTISQGRCDEQMPLWRLCQAQQCAANQGDRRVPINNRGRAIVRPDARAVQPENTRLSHQRNPLAEPTNGFPSQLQSPHLRRKKSSHSDPIEPAGSSYVSSDPMCATLQDCSTNNQL